MPHQSLFRMWFMHEGLLYIAAVRQTFLYGWAYSAESALCPGAQMVKCAVIFRQMAIFH